MKNEETILSNQNLVRSIAKYCFRKYDGNFLELDDMIGTGFLGLIDAVNNFDPNRGKFSTYATYRIKGAILDEMRLMKTKNILNFINIDEVETSLLAAHALSVAAEMSRKEIFSIVENAIKNDLNENERKVINLKYKAEMTSKNIAKRLGLTNGRISQIHKDAIGKIKKCLKSYGITKLNEV